MHRLKFLMVVLSIVTLLVPVALYNDTPDVTEAIAEVDAETQPVVASEAQCKDEWVSLGTFKTSAYCGESYHHICNDGNASKTATGTTPTAGRTIAVDPRKIPYGSQVKINDTIYIAEDCGGAIVDNRVDIFFNTHQEALAFGIRYTEVFILKEGGNDG